jgi:lipopolysaccharide export system permease protein
MKIVTRYILREHIAPFLFAFFTITFLLVIDFVPKIIDQVIDKNLDLLIVLELLALNLAWMLALSVPMSVLVATLMAFGRLSGDFEITAIKASGINLLHILIPLLLAGSGLTYGMIQFHDKVLPDLNKKARMLYGDIQAMRPTLVFESGIFVSDIPGYLVLIDKIDHATSFVEGVRITDTKNPDHPRLIIASNGYLHMTDNGKNMQFSLNAGEIHTLDLKDPDAYTKVDFTNQVINISGASSELVRSESEYRTDREMNIDEMQDNVAKALTTAGPMRARISESLQSRFAQLFSDTLSKVGSDTLTPRLALNVVRSDAVALVRHVERYREQIQIQERIMDKYNIEIHKKYAIPAASLAFILIGAPLGILSRRGGTGMAVTIAILLFIVYWAFLIGGEDIADRGFVSPFWAMWSANILMGAVGLYLNYIVVSERPLFAWFRRPAP